MPIKVRVRKTLVDRLDEQVGSGENEVLVGATGDIYSYGLADVAVSISREYFSDLAAAMMAANPDEATKAFGLALKDGIEAKRELKPLVVTKTDLRAVIEQVNQRVNARIAGRSS